MIIKIIGMVFVFIIFLFMINVTFFKHDKKAVQSATLPLSIKDIKNIGTPEIAKETNITFKPDIRDIFTPSQKIKEQMLRIQNKPRPKTKKKILAKETSPFLTDQDKIKIKQAFKFKGAIIYGEQAVAVINNRFIHMGDRVNGLEVIKILENEVYLKTRRDNIKLELLSYE